MTKPLKRHYRILERDTYSGDTHFVPQVWWGMPFIGWWAGLQLVGEFRVDVDYINRHWEYTTKVIALEVAVRHYKQVMKSTVARQTTHNLTPGDVVDD